MPVADIAEPHQRVSGLQPALDGLVTAVAAPVTVLSAAAGQIRPSGAQGAFAADLRVLSTAVVLLDGADPEPGAVSAGGDQVEFVHPIRTSDAPGHDPIGWLRRRRQARPDGVSETLTLSSVWPTDREVRLTLVLATDFAEIAAVKSGAPAGASVPFTSIGRTEFIADLDGTVVRLALSLPADAAADGSVTVDRTLVVPARGEITLDWSLTVDDPAAVVAPAPEPPFSTPAITADDRRLSALVEKSVGDLNTLAATLPGRPDDVFLAAGSPWYLTLFGRDSLWAARMTLPLGTRVAAGTLFTLAGRQGAKQTPSTAEEPGKILHELRRDSFALGATRLPPAYYGTADATSLWVCLLRDSWRWGLPADQIRALLPQLEAALAWQADYGDADDDGFLEYRDATGHGLANQGWKDSGDAVRFADGRIANGPVALAEVQGYAYEAATAGAELLDAFDQPGADRWRDYAAALKHRFRQQFWVADELGPFPALALDGAKRPVDVPASNMGHLLGTGLLDHDEAALVAARLVHPSLCSGFGLRTMADTAGGYSPLSYHCGSVWPHDTAIAIHGLLREGFVRQAGILAEGLLAAADAFDFRLPELYGGFGSDDVPTPVPYPAACRPQAWSAASAIVLVQAFLGLEADAPARSLTLRPSAAVGAFRVDGLVVGDAGFTAGVNTSGAPIAALPDEWTLHAF